MVYRPTVLGISGSVTRPSRTTALIHAIVDSIAARGTFRTDVIELADAAPHLFSAITPSQIGEAAREILDSVECADLLVVGTPVYRASMTGALKHLFDLVDHRKFSGKPIVLAATGGSLMHGLVTEHQLRPLFGFLNALTLPTTVYAVESDFDNYKVSTAKIGDRIERAADEGAFHLAGLVPARQDQYPVDRDRRDQHAVRAGRHALDPGGPQSRPPLAQCTDPYAA